MKILKNDSVTEILGTILLLMIAVSALSVIYVTTISSLEEPIDTIVDLTGKIENGKIIIKHNGGEQLGPDTRIILAIGDYSSPITFTVQQKFEDKELINSDNEYWNIGEVIEHYDENITRDENGNGPKIEIKVVDKKSNSLVLMGTIQEGYTISGGKGGIWHFDECWPSPYVYDSLNNNTGRLGIMKFDTFFAQKPDFQKYLGPEWINDTTENTAYLNCSIGFDGINDIVEVNDSWTLDIDQNITIEAYFKTIEQETTIRNLETGDHFAYQPKIIHVHGKSHALVGVGQQGGEGGAKIGVIHIVNITEDGQLEVDLPNSTLFYSKIYSPDVIKISEYGEYSIVAVVYSNKDKPNSGYVQTFKMNNTNAEIIETGENEEFEGFNCFEPEIIHIQNDVYAVVYSTDEDIGNGYVKTFHINSDGIITIPSLPRVLFDNFCGDPEIIHIIGDTYAITYRGEQDKGYVKLIKIDNNGVITDNNVDLYQFNEICFEPDIIHVNNTIYAIVYQGNDGNDGCMRTLKITENKVSNNTIAFDKYCYTQDNEVSFAPDITYIKDDIFAIVYSTADITGDGLGKLITIEIQPDGDITGNVELLLDSINMEGNMNCFEPNIIPVNKENRVYAIAYFAKSPHPGFISTVLIGEDPTPPSNRGVFKYGSYGLYTRKYDENLEIFGTLNSDTFTATISDPNDLWHHVKFIYNYQQEMVYIYVDGEQVSQDSYKKQINFTSSPIRFGHKFKGFMDEIKILDKIE